MSVLNVTPPTLQDEINEFIVDRQARNVSPSTLQGYKHALKRWSSYMRELGVEATMQVTATALRRYLVYLKESGHNDGGVHVLFRVMRTYLLWYGEEYDPPEWRNPIRKVKAPRLVHEPLQPVSLESIRAMLDVCTEPDVYGTAERDRAIILMLLDTGLRQAELTQLRIGDVSCEDGSVLVRLGKGRKSRTVFIGVRTRQALFDYLKKRCQEDDNAPLWLTDESTPLTKSGLRQIIRRRAEKAGVPVPGLHDFRRAFAVNSLRSGMDLITLQRLMGHTSLAIINRYLALVNDDLRAAHQQHGAVDNLL